ncbi:MAG: carbohydrate kinase family protein [Verrucomicrobiota bacterium]
MNPEIVRPNVVGLGEVLWDVFPDAAHFGGAPANFACHAAGLGAEAWMVSAVGRDRLGDEAVASLSSKGVHTLMVQRDERPTGTVTVKLDAAGKADYVFASDPAWDHIAWNESLTLLAGKCKAVCFGSLAQRAPESRTSIRRLLQSCSPDCLRVFDVNLRQDFFSREVIEASLGLAEVFKLNDDEIKVLAGLLGLPADEAAFVAQVAARHDLSTVALTRGARGSLIWHKGRFDERVAPEVEVVDTVGAGDAFTAALVTGLLREDDLAQVHRHASDVAAYVCTQPGATPELPQELRR